VQGAVAATLAAMVVREAMAAMAEVGTWESRRCTTRDTSAWARAHRQTILPLLHPSIRHTSNRGRNSRCQCTKDCLRSGREGAEAVTAARAVREAALAVATAMVAEREAMVERVERAAELVARVVRVVREGEEVALARAAQAAAGWARVAVDCTFERRSRRSRWHRVP
jgi:hypothetical protein